jgi:hypothetical protein
MTSRETLRDIVDCASDHLQDLRSALSKAGAQLQEIDESLALLRDIIEGQKYFE